MTNEKGKMIVKVAGPNTPTGRDVARKFPTWAQILGEEVEIDLSTARRTDNGFVHFRATVKTGPLGERELGSLSTSIMDLTREQYVKIATQVSGEPPVTEVVATA